MLRNGISYKSLKIGLASQRSEGERSRVKDRQTSLEVVKQTELSEPQADTVVREKRWDCSKRMTIYVITTWWTGIIM